MTQPIITPAELIKLSQATDQSGGIYNNSDFQGLISTIKSNSALGLFSALANFTLVDGELPQELGTFHNEFRSRGYFTKFDIISETLGILTVSWSHPDFVDKYLVSKKIWSYNFIQSSLNSNLFSAQELYLCQLNGVDLRFLTTEKIIRDIDQKLRQKIARNGEKDYLDPDDSVLKYHITYTGPDSIWQEVVSRDDGENLPVSSSSLTTLFDDVKDELEANDFKVVIDSQPGIYRWVIIWNDPEPEPTP